MMIKYTNLNIATSESQASFLLESGLTNGIIFKKYSISFVPVPTSSAPNCLAR